MLTMFVNFPHIDLHGTISSYGLFCNIKGCNVCGVCGHFFQNFEINFLFCIVVALFDLVHDVETIFHLRSMLTASGNLSEICVSVMPDKLQCAVSQASHIFQKRFADAVSI